MRRLTTSNFIAKAINRHGSAYCYDKTVYHAARMPVLITCGQHGDFEQRPNDHLYGNGCPQCGYSRTGMSARQRMTPEIAIFIDRARAVHGDRYSYENTVFGGSGHFNATIVCRMHGTFTQKVTKHLHGSNCPQCANFDRGVHRRSKNADEFIARAIRLHGTRYDYTNTRYRSAQERVTIGCPKHGDFVQIASHHLSKGGHGCPMCGILRSRVSKTENEWLDYLGVHTRQYPLICGDFRTYVDGYDLATRTVYEFYGDYWHGNPDMYTPETFNPFAKISMGQLLERTLRREERLRRAGHEVVTIWEKDWRQLKKDGLNV